jgi:hypothetical protein
MKKISFLLIIILCFVAIVNGAASALYALHECAADGCAVCLMYQAARGAADFLRCDTPEEIIRMPLAAAAVCLHLLILRHESPHARKVRLNN